MEILKLIQEHASKDLTRYHLTGVYFDENQAVATDGHRLIEVPYESDKDLWHVSRDKIGKIYSFKDYQTIDGKYPNYKAFSFDKQKRPHKLTVTIPPFFKAKKMHMTFLSEEGISFFKPKNDAWIAVDARYLSPYAGMELKMSWGDKLSSLLIEAEKFKVVLMPMRA